MLACNGDTLVAFIVWFHLNIAGISNSIAMIFILVISPIKSPNPMIETYHVVYNDSLKSLFISAIEKSLPFNGL